MNKPNSPKKKIDFRTIFLIIIVASLLWFAFSKLLQPKTQDLDWSGYQTLVKDGKITSSNVSAVGGQNDGVFVIYGDYKNENNKTVNYVCYINEGKIADLDTLVTASSGTYVYKMVPISDNLWLSILPYFMMIITLIIIGLFVSIVKSQAGGIDKMLNVANSNAQMNNQSPQKRITFANVAGCDEEKEEMVELVDFLKSPTKYTNLGAKLPRGVLLYGPPGTGKTLLAKSVAGEANVPFFFSSGSDFVEMYVGVGASRVRDLFRKAKAFAPCIIFIDEIDAIGRKREDKFGGGGGAEYSQTINQLLVEMDGFQDNAGIIVIGATNRSDVLDPALLRPGRFDRQIMVNLPDVKGREAILKVHARNKPLDSKVNFEAIAKRTSGFSGADLENLLNEAAILTAKENKRVIGERELEESIDRVVCGVAKKSRTLSERSKKITAYHEAGHAVIGLKVKGALTVQKVTIIPRGQALGYNLLTNESDDVLITERELFVRIMSYLGGRVSENIFFNESTTGASDDFKQATDVAFNMVCRYGMSELGVVNYINESSYYDRFSPEYKAKIDDEVNKIVNKALKETKEVIEANKDLLVAIAESLLNVETLTKEDIEEISTTLKIKTLDTDKPNTQNTENNDQNPNNVTSSTLNTDSNNNDNNSTTSNLDASSIEAKRKYYKYALENGATLNDLNITEEELKDLGISIDNINNNNNNNNNSNENR